MNDLEKAKLVLADRNITLKTISEKTGIPFQTVKGYSANLYKLKGHANDMIKEFCSEECLASDF